MSKSISVVMTTYNGISFVLEQLKSIENQSLTPDEVIICDDRSTDGTFDAVEKFISERGLTHWKAYKNNENMGWKRNFFHATRLSSGDIVFFSDQDDIWRSNKIETMASIMNETAAGAVFGDAQIIDEFGEISRTRAAAREWTHQYREVPFSKSFASVKTLGCRMCISREIADTYLSLRTPEAGHDSQCGRLALLLSSLYYLDSPVIDYRIHNQNSSGVSAERSFGSSTLEKRQADIEDSILWLGNIADSGLQLNHNKRRTVEKTLEMQTKRLEYLRTDNPFLLVYLLKYLPYYSSLSMYLGDFAYKHNINEIMGKLRWRLKRGQS